MTRSYTQVPPDSTGDKLAMQTYTQGADTVSVQGVYQPGLPTYRAVTADITPANSKYHCYLQNNAGSGQSLIVLGISVVHTQVSAVTGVVNRFDLRLATGASPAGGAAITPIEFNSDDPALSGVTAYGGATSGVSDSSIVVSRVLTSEENTTAVGNFMFFSERFPMLTVPPAPGRPMTLRPGEGIGVKQNGAGTVGTFQWIIDFAVEAD